MVDTIFYYFTHLVTKLISVSNLVTKLILIIKLVMKIFSITKWAKNKEKKRATKKEEEINDPFKF